MASRAFLAGISRVYFEYHYATQSGFVEDVLEQLVEGPLALFRVVANPPAAHIFQFFQLSSDDVLRRSPLSVWTRRDSHALYVSTVCCESCEADGASRDSANWLFVHATLPWCERG